MKRTISSILSILLILSLCVTVCASDPGAPRIVDNAGVLSADELADLTQRAYDLRNTYDMDVVILTVNSLDGKSAQAYADDYYDYNGYGVGEDYSGVLLLIAMDSREWWISTCGEAIYAITDYGIERLFSEMSWYLSENRFYSAFDAYLDALPEYFEAYHDGDPLDGYAGSYDGPGSYSPGDADEIVYYDPNPFGISSAVISLVIGCAVAAVVLLFMKSSMNTKRKQHGAAVYVKTGSYHLRKHSDVFLYSNVSKVRRQENSSSGSRGGGSSTHRSSSGRSHGGGGGRF